MQNKGSEMSKEHILVCLSSSPSNERIVRMAEKMAQAFCGSLTALYVQTPGDADMNAEDTVRLQANMRLAQQLGAEIVTTHGEDVPTQIAEYARLSDVTKIVIGRSGGRAGTYGSGSRMGTGVGNRVIRQSHKFDVSAFAKKGGDMKKTAPDYEVGDTVKHIKFGTGVVQAIKDGGKDYEVTVDFPKYGPKKMFAGFAKLKKV